MPIAVEGDRTAMGLKMALESLLQNRALSCGTGLLGYGWRV
jgi:hypothetical protein